MFAHINNKANISYVVGSVANLTAKPSTMHYRIVRCIFKYLQSSVYLGLCYYGGPNANILQAYSNVNFANDLFDNKSCNGFLVSMNGGPILWGSRKQIGETSSITKDEYVIGNIATKEVVRT